MKSITPGEMRLALQPELEHLKGIVNQQLTEGKGKLCIPIGEKNLLLDILLEDYRGSGWFVKVVGNAAEWKKSFAITLEFNLKGPDEQLSELI
jgi:hypothetical protein